VWEDGHLLVVNKPAGMTAHASNFQPNTPTVAGALAWQRGTDFVFHPVNRLDKGTTGLMVVAKSGYVHDRLRRSLHSRSFQREYRAVCIGCPDPPKGTIDGPIGRDESSTIRRMVRPDGAPAVSHYEVLRTGNGLSLVKLTPETGRTHQLRVHMASIGHPLAGDWLYGTEDVDLIPRPALHSWALTMTHPVTGEILHLTAPLPEDMARLVPEIHEIQ
jgi:RluA family pseudouridine synthase